MKLIVFLIAIFLSTHALADEASKRAKIIKLSQAQGLEKMFEQQVEQGKASAATMARDMAARMLADSGAPASEGDPKAQQLIERYAMRAASLISAKEFSDTWVQSFGHDLSDADLDKMLAYYRSPVGQRDVRATQAAMVKFNLAITTQTQQRMNGVVDDMIKELKAITAK